MKNQNKIQILIFLLLIFISTTSFSQLATYFPNASNTLKLNEAKDLNFSIGSFKEKSRYFNTRHSSKYGLEKEESYNIQLAYSPLKHLGISIHHTRFNFPWIEFDYKIQQSGFSIGGYYNLPCKPQKKSEGMDCKIILFDFYAGYSFGDLNASIKDIFRNSNESSGDGFSLNSHNVYLQGGAHWIGDFVHLSGLIRTGNINYYKGSIDGGINRLHFDEIGDLLNERNFLFLDYSLKAEINYKGVGIYFEVRHELERASEKKKSVLLKNLGLAFNVHKIYQNILNQKKQ